ncbi:unnamed protein product [Heterobilharzia americana]|nr:unnamed protein product [Heterobilharzia americana]
MLLKKDIDMHILSHFALDTNSTQNVTTVMMTIKSTNPSIVTKPSRKIPVIKIFWNGSASPIYQTKWNTMWTILITTILYLMLSRH